jgi:hypothetical protein
MNSPEHLKYLYKPHEGFIIRINQLMMENQVVKTPPNNLLMNSQTFYRMAFGMWGITEGTEASIKMATDLIKNNLI